MNINKIRVISKICCSQMYSFKKFYIPAESSQVYTFTSETILNQLKVLNEAGEYDSALKLVDKFKLDKQYVITIVRNIKKDIQTQARLINKYQLPISEFTDVIDKINNDCVKYYLNTYSWERCEEILSEYKVDLLPILIEQLYFKQKNDEAISIVLRQKILENIKNQDLKVLLQTQITQNNFKYVENKLFQFDAFAPTDCIINDSNIENFITNQEFGINEDQTLFIDNDQSKIFQVASEALSTEQITGLDTEFTTPKTKFDQKKQSIQILQVSTQKFNFVFDVVALKNSVRFKELLIRYLTNPNQIKIGHTLLNDISLVCNYLKIKNICINNLIDVKNIFLKIQENQNKSNLAYIAQQFFGKKLSKSEQCSNWARRPLRKAQIHYASLDALICIKIYEKLSEMDEEISQKNMISLNV